MVRRTLVMILVGLLPLTLASTATASTKTLYHIADLDSIASEVAGTPLAVVSSDSAGEWFAITRDPGVFGFTCLSCGPSSLLFNPWDGKLYYMYRTIWIAPIVLTAFADVAQNGLREGMNYTGAATAFLVLDHEAQHWRLFSSDEARVNACALKDIPRLLQADFHLAATADQTVTVQQQYRVKVRVKIKGHWRYRYQMRTRYVTQVVTVPNPVYVNLIQAAQLVYQSQPYPYNAGTC